jgi:hypothetical protein
MWRYTRDNSGTIRFRDCTLDDDVSRVNRYGRGCNVNDNTAVKHFAVLRLFHQLLHVRKRKDFIGYEKIVRDAPLVRKGGIEIWQ